MLLERGQHSPVDNRTHRHNRHTTIRVRTHTHRVINVRVEKTAFKAQTHIRLKTQGNLALNQGKANGQRPTPRNTHNPWLNGGTGRPRLRGPNLTRNQGKPNPFPGNRGAFWSWQLPKPFK